MQNLSVLTGMFWFDSGGFVVDRRIAIRRLRAKGERAAALTAGNRVPAAALDRRWLIGRSGA